jgi:small-conductance mechanosensitive channel
MRWLQTTTLLGDRLLDWLTALGIAAAVLLALLGLKRLAARRLARLAERTETDLDDFVIGLARRTRTLLVAVPSLYLGSLYLELPAGAARGLKGAAALAVFLQVALWSTAGIDYWMTRQHRRREQDAAAAALMSVLRFAAKLVLWSVVLLLALDNLGVDVTTLVAGLGIGGVAVALALQNVLGDLLASLSIAFDKPFVIGEAITVDDLTGTVESIGMKTTRLRSVSGEQLVLANGELLKSRIRNWTRMSERRVVLSFGVLYETPAGAVERIPEIVRGLVEEQDLTRFDRTHFKAFGASSLDFEAVYWILSPDYRTFMDRQQAINLGLLRAFQEEGIGFAYPTQTLILQRDRPGRDRPHPLAPSPEGEGE